MSLLVTGSIGIDTVETPDGRADGVLGGSAVYFARAAALFGPVRLVGVVGGDFPLDLRGTFAGLPVDMAGLEVRSGSKTFRWHGRYLQDMNQRETVVTELNVLGEAGPSIPPAFRDSRFVFLANTHPALQGDLLAQLRQPQLVVCDTMNLWIETARAALIALLRRVDGVVVNEEEARQLSGRGNLAAAAATIRALGPRFVIVKKGEHGALLDDGEEPFVLPAYPTTEVVDPTGAGDSFAGGMMGYLAALGRTDGTALRAAVARGTVAASLAIEGFSLDGFARADAAVIRERLGRLRRLSAFE